MQTTSKLCLAAAITLLLTTVGAHGRLLRGDPAPASSPTAIVLDFGPTAAPSTSTSVAPAPSASFFNSPAAPAADGPAASEAQAPAPAPSVRNSPPSPPAPEDPEAEVLLVMQSQAAGPALAPAPVSFTSFLSPAPAPLSAASPLSSPMPATADGPGASAQEPLVKNTPPSPPAPEELAAQSQRLLMSVPSTVAEAPGTQAPAPGPSPSSLISPISSSMFLGPSASAPPVEGPAAEAPSPSSSMDNDDIESEFTSL